jgi:hypothetical protein
MNNELKQSILADREDVMNDYLSRKPENCNHKDEESGKIAYNGGWKLTGEMFTCYFCGKDITELLNPQSPEKKHDIHNGTPCTECGEHFWVEETATHPEKFKEVLEEFDKDFGQNLIAQKTKLYYDGKYSKGWKQDSENAIQEVKKIRQFLLLNLEKAREEGYRIGRSVRDLKKVNLMADHIRQEERQRVIEIIEDIIEKPAVWYETKIMSKARILILQSLINKLKE